VSLQIYYKADVQAWSPTFGNMLGPQRLTKEVSKLPPLVTSFIF